MDGPCGDGCACVIDATEAPTSTSVRLTAKPVDLPIACTLEPGAMPNRLADWRAILDQALARTIAADGALRVELDDDLDLDELARLVAAEQHCCAFFSFAITVDARGIGLEVRAPAGAADIVTSLFGSPA
jgi:MerR family transcriptional regulator, copper efflux regulator